MLILDISRGFKFTLYDLIDCENPQKLFFIFWMENMIFFNNLKKIMRLEKLLVFRMYKNILSSKKCIHFLCKNQTEEIIFFFMLYLFERDFVKKIHKSMGKYPFPPTFLALYYRSKLTRYGSRYTPPRKIPPGT